MIRPQCLVILALSLLAYPCVGEISLEDALEGFDFKEPENNTVGSELSDLDEILGEFDSPNEIPITNTETPDIMEVDSPSIRLSGSIRQKFIVNFFP